MKGVMYLKIDFVKSFNLYYVEYISNVYARSVIMFNMLPDVTCYQRLTIVQSPKQCDKIGRS